MPDIWMDVDANLTEVPVNILPLIDDTDFKTREVAIAYNQAGMDLVWNFVTTAGGFTQTAVTPTTSGDYDWTHQGDGMYTIEIPASGGASINNNTEGTGWFTGICTGVLPWRGPTIGFRAAATNDALIDGSSNLVVIVGAMGADVLTSGALATSAVNEIRDAILSDSTAFNGADIASILTDTGTTLPATLGTPADTDLATDIANIATSLGAIRVNKNTALANFPFLMTDSTNHAPATGLTVTATRSIDGAAFGACANSVVEVASGIYKINLAAADLNGDTIVLRFTAAASDDTVITIVTQA